jgi:outer membrane lipoprotein-sorting protein
MGSLALVASLTGGCAISRKTAVAPAKAVVPLLTATKADLVAKFDRQADAVTSINAGLTMQLTAGAAYTGVIEQYDKVNGFILAQKPSSIRVIGQVPVVGTNIFDMVSDGETFHIFIPSKNQFLVGSTRLEHPSAKPQENIRPQHLIDAIFWQAIPNDTPVLFEEATAADEVAPHYYILTIVQRPGGDVTRNAAAESGNSTAAAPDWEITRKIWFDRSNLNVSQIQTYDPDGKMNSDIHYGAWNTTDPVPYPRQISVHRITEDYQLQIEITKVTMNEPVEASRFVLAQPPNSTLVRVGEESKEPQPLEPKSLESKPAEPKS